MAKLMPTGHASSVAYSRSLAGMARLDRLSQRADETIEALVLGHCDVAGTREIDSQFLYDS
jgi:hypothetical protein